MADLKNNKYYEAYYNNEYDANRNMIFALLFSAAMLLLIWIGYFTNLFVVNNQTRLLINIIFPVLIVLLLLPLPALKNSYLKKARFKYYLLIDLLLVIAVLNILLPKHGIIGWAIVIIITNHYYNPKFGKIIFITTIILMLLCLYAGMFLGEFDSNLLTGQDDDANGLLYNYFLGNVPYPDTPQGRLNYLRDLKAVGMNRYLTTFVFYYLARLVNISIVFFVSNSLNKRTYKLLIDEIKVNTEQERTKAELDYARDIQLQTLPKEFVTNKDIEIQAELKAARTVGGDFYDYFVLDDDNVVIMIGDVSGKGIGAAMFMMKTITCFRNAVSSSRSPREILEIVNRQLCNRNDSNMFVTCFFAKINIKTGLMTFANAGHTKPIVGQKMKYNYLNCDTGLVLGGFEEAFFIDEEYQLKKGDTITLYTDGITEAKSEDGELFGEKRLIEFFNKKKYSCLVELHAELKDCINSFAKIDEQNDDITYITLKFHGDEYAYEEKLFKSNKEEVKKMLDFLDDFSQKHNLDMAFSGNLLVVADELLSNICKYGYKDKIGEVYIRALYNINDREFILTIVDKGIPFNPFTHEGKAIEGDIDEIKEGGLGILIVKNLMSEYAYDRINNKNIITLKKFL